MIEKRIAIHSYSLLASLFLAGLCFGFSLAIALFGLFGVEYGYRQYLSLAILIVLFFAFACLSALFLHLRIEDGRKKGFILGKFGTVEDVYSEKDIASIAKKMVKGDQNEKVLCVAFSIAGPGGQALSSLQNDVAKKTLRFVLKSLRVGFPLNPIGITSDNEFLLLHRTQNEDAFIDGLRVFLIHLSDTFAHSGSLPFASLLGGVSSRPAVKPLAGRSLVEEAEFALRHSAARRLSCDVLRFSQSLVDEDASIHWLDADLNNAIERGEFVVYYQGKVNLNDMNFYGAEALVRWKHPHRGILPPSVFVPYCESSGKIVEIDHFVFRTVCASLAKWKAEPTMKNLIVSVNLSRRTVYDPNLLSFLSDTVARFGVDPNKIELELTESLAAENLIFISSVIKKIKALGFHTSIDDFGIGYSSLSALKSIPYDVLKIDKSFIDDIEIEPKAQAMVASIVELVHTLGMEVIAEGVESAKQAEILRHLHCDAIQGYYFSRPVDRGRFEVNIAEASKGGKKA